MNKIVRLRMFLGPWSSIPLAAVPVPALHLARLLDARSGTSAAHDGLSGYIRPISRSVSMVWVSGEVEVAGEGFIT